MLWLHPPLGAGSPYVPVRAASVPLCAALSEPCVASSRNDKIKRNFHSGVSFLFFSIFTAYHCCIAHFYHCCIVYFMLPSFFVVAMKMGQSSTFKSRAGCSLCRESWGPLCWLCWCDSFGMGGNGSVLDASLIHPRLRNTDFHGHLPGGRSQLVYKPSMV